MYLTMTTVITTNNLFDTMKYFLLIRIHYNTCYYEDQKHTFKAEGLFL